jgi:dipeptidyl aminopeptidase/acylaminoacyl peptidase
MHLQKAYTLSPDGKTLYMTSIKSGGVGGYDIWASDLKGSTWGELRNLYLPLNSKAHEGCPTFTPDEKTIYFMRCEKMDMQKTDRCKIFVSRKNATGQWEEPTELPANINTGNSQNPRIMADGETLIFASDKISPNKGGMDVYVTKFRNGTWSDPVPLDDVNTDKDDQYVSAQANGRYLIKEAPGKYRSEAVEYLIPDELRSKGVMRVDGTVKNEAGAPTPAYISVTNLYDNKRTFSGRPEADGSFYFYLLEGGAYELAVDHEESTYTYYTQEYDLLENASLRNEKIEVVLKPLAAGDELLLDALQFMPNSAELDNASTEMRRLTRLLKATSAIPVVLEPGSSLN